WNRGAERRAAGLEPDGADEAFPSLGGWLESDPQELANGYRRLYIPGRDGRHLKRNAANALRNVELSARRHRRTR
ncbi:MAG: hypothetical protein ACXVY5_09775, partial [Gaiellales bacterium]